MANGAAGVVAGMRAEIEALVRHRLERVLAEIDMVPRDEFEAVRDMAAAARAEAAALAERVAALEADKAPARKARGGARRTRKQTPA